MCNENVSKNQEPRRGENILAMKMYHTTKKPEGVKIFYKK
jgi:hypothetical protein